MKVGFIDYYLDEWHANHYPKMISDASNGELVVAYAYGKIPSPITGKTSEEWCSEYGVTLCETIEVVVEKSDVLIVLSPDNCEMHEELTRLPLMSGKKTYVDKTFAPDRKSAEAMFRLAEDYGTPCYSTSALRFATEYRAFLGKEIKAMNTWGPYGLETYSIHQLEPVMMLMKGEAKRVMVMTQGEWANLLIAWEDGRSASCLCTGGECPSVATVCLENRSEFFAIESDSFGGFIKNMVEFFRTGEIPVSHAETISIMAVREAAIKAAKSPGTWVSVE